MVPRLENRIDQNFALREAVKRAAQTMTASIYKWDKDKTARYYDELYAGRSHLYLDLKHPDDIESSQESTDA